MFALSWLKHLNVYVRKSIPLETNNAPIFFSDWKTGRCSSTVQVRLLCFWDARNVRRGDHDAGDSECKPTCNSQPNTSPDLTYAGYMSLCLFYYCESDLSFAVVTLGLDLLLIGPSLFSGKLNKAANCERGKRKRSKAPMER
ncbi:hypothetical protein YC2023_083624 [Brassica napus]